MIETLVLAYKIIRYDDAKSGEVTNGNRFPKSDTGCS